MKWEHCYASLADQSLSLPRFGHSAVAISDPNGGCQVVIYGGVGCNAGETAQTALGDVAMLQVDAGTWSAPDILAGNSPGPRAFHSAVAHTGRMLVFGGHILTFDAEHNRKRRNSYNDLWQLDLVDWQWSQVAVSATSTIPAKRDMAALLQLTDHQLLLFGGRSESGKALQDTWLLDLDSNTWQQVKPVGVLPPPRKMHSMAKVASQVVLFGGEGDSGPLDDLWLLAGFGPGEMARWTAIKLRGSPPPRFGHAMTACPALPSGGEGVSGAAGATTSSSSRPSSAGSRSDAGQADTTDISPFITTATATAAAAAARDSSVACDANSSSSSSEAPAADVAAGESGASGGAAQQQQQQRVVVFGGCLDVSGFLSLNKSYVQSRETWVLLLEQLKWVQLPPPPAAGAAGGSDALSSSSSSSSSPPWPCERMCHSLTALPDGRLLVVGGRNKEGICRDSWLLDTSGDLPAVNNGSASGSLLPPPPASPRPSTAGSTGSTTPGAPAAATTTTVGGTTQPSPSRPGSQSLLQSLLGPVRARVPSQGMLVRRDSASLAAAGPSTPDTNTPHTSQPASPKRPHGGEQQQQQQQQQDVADTIRHQQQPADISTMGAATAGGAGAAAQPASSVQQQQASAAAAAAASGVSHQPLSSLMDVSSGEIAKLLRNPAAYSAGAINKLSSSVTSTVSSLLVGKDGQPGPMLPRLPEALMRVAPSWAPGPFGTRGSNTGNSSSQQMSQQQQDTNMAALDPLKQQMGLTPGSAAAGGGGACGLKAPTHVLQELAVLGQQLLSDSGGAIGGAPLGATPSGSFAANSSIPPDVLVAAARQHLMSAEVGALRLPHVALLLADYQQLAASYYAHMMLSRLSEGFPAAAATARASQAIDGGGQCGSAYLQRQPADLMINQVQQLQVHYRQLFLQSTA